MDEIKKSNEGAVKFLEEKLQRTTAKKKEAEEDEKAYTYRMWGPWEGMWRNDVRLAKEKVQRFTQEEQALRAQIEAARQGNNEEQKKQCEKKLTQEKFTYEAQRKNCEAALKTLAENNVELNKAIQTTTAKMQYILETEGCQNVDHLLDTMEALRDVSKSGARYTDAGEVTAQGWIKELNTFALMLQKMVNSKSLANQKKHYALLRGHTSKEDPIFKLLGCCQPVLTLVDVDAPTRQRPGRNTTPLIMVKNAKFTEAELKEICEPALKQVDVKALQDVDVQQRWPTIRQQTRCARRENLSFRKVLFQILTTLSEGLPDSVMCLRLHSLIITLHTVIILLGSVLEPCTGLSMNACAITVPPLPSPLSLAPCF